MPQEPKKFYIKERYNPQTGTYYTREGRLSKTAARRVETLCIYGSNTMLPFDTKEEMDAAFEKLALQGNCCQ